MVDLHLVLTNEQRDALIPVLDKLEVGLVKRVEATQNTPRVDRATAAYTALGFILKPLRAHKKKHG